MEELHDRDGLAVLILQLNERLMERVTNHLYKQEGINYRLISLSTYIKQCFCADSYGAQQRV